MNIELRVFLQQENECYVSLCPELDIASQGDTHVDARKNLKKALDLFFEHAPLEEIQRRLSSEIYVNQIEHAVTTLSY